MRPSPCYLLAAVWFLTSACASLLRAEPPGRSEKLAGIVSHIRHEQVASSGLAGVGYSKRLHALEIEFVSGAIYRYEEVPLTVYRELMAAKSKAHFYDTNVRGKYRSVHVRPRSE